MSGIINTALLFIHLTTIIVVVYNVAYSQNKEAESENKQFLSSQTFLKIKSFMILQKVDLSSTNLSAYLIPTVRDRYLVNFIFLV